MGMAWSSLSADTSPVESPFSWMRTRKPLKPRMTGRLEPGANVVAAMPGLAASASPSVAEGWLSSWPGVITVTATKVWSGEIGKGAPARSGAAGAGWAAAAGACAGAAGAWAAGGDGDGAWRRHENAGQLGLRLGIDGRAHARSNGRQQHNREHLRPGLAHCQSPSMLYYNID